MEGTRVRRLETRDIDAAIGLTDLEDWGYTPADFRRLLSLSPDGCFAAEQNGTVVGVLTTTTYEGLAFLGAVIVRPDLRGKGVGKQMMGAALEHLRSSGVGTVRLNAYLNAIPFYEKLGFRREYEVVRWHGPAATGRSAGVRPVRIGDLAALARFDSTFFGADRRPLLGRLADEFPESFLVFERNQKPIGYIVGNVSGESCEIGPWVVRPPGEAEARSLYYGLVAASGATAIALSGPSANEALGSFIEGIRFQEVFRAMRMTWGEDRFGGDPAGIWGVGGLEKG
ncbi:MAG TPA: GNAT family N-acetyltransferase [Thermoplasmata archaeon]|nr:GNAT family N-acetyltransferase [Thermoplasmata archaeon]